MNPYFQYQVVKTSLISRAHCPHCQHRLQVMRKDNQRQITCLKCGRKFRISGNVTPARQIKKKIALPRALKSFG